MDTGQQSEEKQEMEELTMENIKAVYTARDIASDLSISEKEAAGLVKELQRRLKESGKYVIAGYVPVAYYETQKASGFIDTDSLEEAGRVPLTEKRLLNIEDFCKYAGGISEKIARKHIKHIGVEVCIGKRIFADRVKFDEWCSKYNTEERQ